MTKAKKQAFILAAVVFTAFNLRAPITCVGPLLDTLRQDLGLSGSVAGFLTTIPLLAFAALSPFAGRLAARFGVGRALLWSMLFIALGAAARSWLGSAGLLLGTVAIGIGIGCGNVLLPVVIKARYPDKIGPMTGVYTTAMSMFAGLSSALCVPLARIQGFGWHGALAVWGVPALLAAALWFPRRALPPGAPSPAGGAPGARVWRSRVAWHCAAYMGTQSIVYYSFVAWLPAILSAKGVESAAAGYMTSAYQLIGIAANFFAPTVAGRLKDQRPLTGGVGLLYILGMALLWTARSPAPLMIAVLLCGFGTGCAFSLCMALIGMRTRNAEDASRLSGMLQTVGYAVAALGPVLVGRALDASGSWSLPLGCLLLGIVINSAIGQWAGRPGLVE